MAEPSVRGRREVLPVPALPSSLTGSLLISQPWCGCPEQHQQRPSGAQLRELQGKSVFVFLWLSCFKDGRGVKGEAGSNGGSGVSGIAELLSAGGLLCPRNCPGCFAVIISNPYKSATGWILYLSHLSSEDTEAEMVRWTRPSLPWSASSSGPRQLASRVEGNLMALAVDEGKGLPVSRHPRRLASLCALDGLLSAELQTCIFRKGRDFCVYVQSRSRSRTCKPVKQPSVSTGRCPHAGGPIFWLVGICHDSFRGRTDPLVSCLDRLSAKSSQGSGLGSPQAHSWLVGSQPVTSFPPTSLLAFTPVC